MVKELLTLLVAFLVFHGNVYDYLLIHVNEHDLKNDSLMFTFFAICIVHETIVSRLKRLFTLVFG